MRAMPSTPRRALEGRRAALLLALVIALASLGIRALPRWDSVVERGRVVVSDPDACYHLRRAERIAQGVPHLAVYDRYINYPDGAHVIWPPLYDLALAGALTVFPVGDGHALDEGEAGRADRALLRGPGVAVGFVPPFLLALAVLVVFRMARRLWPARPLLWAVAAGTPALLPSTLAYTEIGRLDHHAAELLALVVFLDTLMSALGRLASGSASAGATREAPLAPAVARAALVPAVALAGALSTQLTLVLLVPAAAVILIAAPARERTASFLFAVLLFAGAALLLLPFAIVYHAAGASFAHHQFGLFQPALLLAAASGFVLLLALAGIPARRARWPLRAALAGPALVALVWLGARLTAETAGGAAYLIGRSSRWQATIGESQSPFAMGAMPGAESLLAGLSALVLLAPFALVRLARGARGDPARRVVAIASTLFLAAGLLQTRFLPHAALFVGLLAAVAIEAIGGIRARDRAPAPSASRRPRDGATSGAGIGAGLVVAAILLAALLPSLGGGRAPEEADLAFARSRSVLGFLALETPPTSDGPDPRERPEYGVMAEWSFGHFIQYHGRRPALADNFGEHAGDPARPRAFFLESDGARAVAMLDSLEARYLLVRDLAGTFAGLVPDAEESERYVARAAASGAGRAAIDFRPEIMHTALYRLAWRDGAGFLAERPAGGARSSQTWVPPISGLRLVAESDSLEAIPGGPTVPYVKLYERVRGALLRVQGLKPGEEAALLAKIRSPRGRSFAYVDRLVANASGTAEVSIPYPTIAVDGASRIESAEIVWRDRSAPLPAIDESAVRSGATIIADLAEPRPSVAP